MSKYYVNPNIKDLYRVKFHDERKPFLRLDMNENPEGIPEEIFREIMEKVTPSFLATYPEKDKLLELLAVHNEIKKEQISLTAGSDEAMRLIFQCFGQEGKTLLSVTPSFEMYSVYANMFGMNHATVEYSDSFSVSVNDICKQINQDTGIVVLLNPNSPIGTIYSGEDLCKVLDLARASGAIVVIDEAYYYFNEKTFMPLIDRYDNVLVLRTFSKLFSLAGLRIGYVSGNEQLIDYVEKAQSTFNVNNVAILFATELIQREDLICKLIDVEKEGHEWLLRQLQGEGYKALSLKGNYILFYPNYPSNEIVEAMKQRGVLVRDYGKGILQGWIRISTGSIDCMKKFWETYQGVINEME